MQAAFASGEIVDANRIAEEITKAGIARGVPLAELAEMVLAEAARYGGSGTKVGD